MMRGEWFVTAIMVTSALLVVTYGNSGRMNAWTGGSFEPSRDDRNDTRARADAIIAYLTAHP